MPTAIEIIRANLIGLPADITDTVIQVIIDSSSSLHDAAIALCDSAASLAIADGAEDIKIGTLAIGSSGKTAQYWLAIKDNLIKRAITGEGVIIDPNTPGNAKYAGYAAAMTGEDIPQQTWTGQFDNPPFTDPAYE